MALVYACALIAAILCGVIAYVIYKVVHTEHFIDEYIYIPPQMDLVQKKSRKKLGPMMSFMGMGPLLTGGVGQWNIGLSGIQSSLVQQPQATTSSPSSPQVTLDTTLISATTSAPQTVAGPAWNTIPVPPNPTLPSEYAPSFPTDKVKILGEKYTKDQFLKDIDAVLAFYPNPPNKQFWNPSETPGTYKNKIDEFYYAIATALFTFFPDVGFNIRDFYRVCICNAHVETTLNPYCAYTPEMMDFIFYFSVSPGILQASPAPQCMGFIHWGRPLMDLSKKIMATPLPPGNPNPRPGDLKKIAYLRLDNAIYCMLIWGWAQRNMSSLCTESNNLDNPCDKPPPTEPYTYQNLCDVWRDGSKRDPGIESQYVKDIHARWTKANFLEEDWTKLMDTKLPILKNGIGIDYKSCNVSAECYKWDLQRAGGTMGKGCEKNFPAATTPDVNAIKPIGPALPIEELGAFIDIDGIQNITEIKALTSYSAAEYEFTKFAGNCGNVNTTGTNRIGEPISADKLA